MPEEFVDVFDGSLLPALVGVGVVDFGLKSALDEGVIHELWTIVTGDGVDLESFEETLGNAGDLARPLGFEEAGKDITGLALDENEEWTPPALGLDEIHFPVSVMKPAVDGGRAVIDGKSLVSGDAGLSRASVVSS